MDFLQVALVFLILLLSIFLAITGFQVFFILRDLKKALDRLNKVLDTSDQIVSQVEKPVKAASNLVTALSTKARELKNAVRRPNPKRFYKKVL